MVTLRDYQKECIDKILECPTNSCVITKLPTASGKTVILSGLIQQVYFQDESSRFLIVVPSTELREQTKDKIEMVCGKVDIGFVQGALDEVSNRIVISTRQSLTHSKSTRISRMKEYGEFDYIIFDEAHQAVFQQEKIIKQLNMANAKVIGLTATPYNEEMKKIYTEIIYRRDIMDMIIQGYLVEPRCKLIYSNTDISSVKTTAGEFNLGQLEDCVNNDDRNQLIVDAYNKFAKDRRSTIIFATGIEHAKSIADCFNQNGIKCYSLDSNDTKEDRDRIIEGFKNGNVKVLVNVSILSTGFDYPNLDTIILARPTQSRILYEQIVGRGLRLAENKKDCLLIDVVDIARQHNIMSMKTIFDIDIKDGETPTEAKDRIAKLEKEEQERLEQERLQREEEERRKQELIAEEIELFNSTMRNIIYFSNLDWFRFDDNTYSLMGDMIHSIVIRKTNDNEFTIYTGTKEKFLNLSEEYMTNNLQDAITYCENIMLEYGTSYLRKDSKWKHDNATSKQLVYVNQKMQPYVKTKWDATKYFYNSSLYSAFKHMINQK